MSSSLIFENVISRLFKASSALRSICQSELDYMLDDRPLASVVFGSILISAFEKALNDRDDAFAESALILFDNGTPRGPARHLSGHTIVDLPVRGWEEFANGTLIDAAKQAGFEMILTTDKNI